jgi:7,8-dihydropterin-6-yl-methyl-4-(beta-D-ribofuranosyl)aminobenzene 5'-phosphate synthase
MRRLLFLCLAMIILAPHAALATQVKALKVTVLSTMLTSGDEIAEWGYAALVEVDGRRILFDTGARPDTVLTNAKLMGIDLSTVEEVVISHNHGDHTGGLMTLRRELMKTNPKALAQVHVAEGFFLPQVGDGPRNGLNHDKAAFEATGGRFIVHQGPYELAPGVWLTGPVPRHTQEHNYPPSLRVQTSSGTVADTVPEDQAMVFETADGPVILTGCGHAGIVNIVADANALTHTRTVLAVIGGLHIFAASDATLAWTGAQLKAVGLRYLLAGHCTGLEATWRLRQITGLDRRTAAYGAVGSTFVLGRGIDPGVLAR